MKTINRIHILRAWHPKTVMIRKKIFLRSEIIIGSDPSAHFRFEDLEGLTARLDLESGELTYLNDGRSLSLQPEQIFEIGPLAFQWRVIRISATRWLTGFAILLGGLILMGLSSTYESESPNHPHCSNFAQQLSQGRWERASSTSDAQAKTLEDLKKLRLSFQRALESKNLVLARAELEAMAELIASGPHEEGCRLDAEVLRLEMKFSEFRIRSAVQDKLFKEAAQEVGRLAQRIQNRKILRWIKQLRRKASDLYIEGYQLEEDEPEKAERLMDQAEQICLALQLDSECFRSKNASEP